MVGDMNISPIYSENQIEVSTEISVAATKAYMGDKEGNTYPFYWNTSG